MKLFSSGFNLIQPSLIQQLKKILDQYPDDGQILKVRQRLFKRFQSQVIRLIYQQKGNVSWRPRAQIKQLAWRTAERQIGHRK